MFQLSCNKALGQRPEIPGEAGRGEEGGQGLRRNRRKQKQLRWQDRIIGWKVRGWEWRELRVGRREGKNRPDACLEEAAESISRTRTFNR